MNCLKNRCWAVECILLLPWDDMIELFFLQIPTIDHVRVGRRVAYTFMHTKRNTLVTMGFRNVGICIELELLSQVVLLYSKSAYIAQHYEDLPMYITYIVVSTLSTLLQKNPKCFLHISINQHHLLFVLPWKVKRIMK